MLARNYELTTNGLIFMRRKKTEEEKRRKHHGHRLVFPTWDSLSELVAFEVRPKRGKGASHVSKWRGGMSSRQTELNVQRKGRDSNV